MNERKKYMGISKFIIAFIIVRIIRSLTGFNYNFSEGIFNIKILIDLGLWIIVYLIIDFIFNKLSLSYRE
ncbi:hypothetical protein Curi_c24760 [Gottschalkia acidurici 9a]|uniref:Uncharacterized protein n=1 Tax=Gottschalkia acidurici (strain ATCC 7906 / DSM 604 / BCRC 14475 / CIP 104303 / KCTC 5404 / NCIMB 10678 / 9a) TaxID=1128398 RepID=K0B4J9_GOTA9|nr:hypothetical protein [Gottschalkia acidurici]AFS79471.1 hypothetical protein Curi_c24760 [Gottschalkia acidurici 9a]